MVDNIQDSPIEAFEVFLEQPENQDRLFELINGEIVEKMPTEEHGIIAGNIITELNIHLRQNNLKGRVGAEVRHRVPTDDANSRLPDVRYHADTSQPIVKKGAVPYMPDLAIEIQSPDDSLKQLREKARYYLANGSKLVCLILPEQRLVEVITADEESILTENDTLTGGDVLPEFQLPVTAIFPEVEEG